MHLCGFSDEDDEKHEDLYAAMQEVLDHLSSVMTLEAFLSVLPSSAASSKPDSDEHDFQGHIQMCRKNQQAHQVYSIIFNIFQKYSMCFGIYKYTLVYSDETQYTLMIA